MRDISESLKAYCERTNQKEILEQWNYEKNKELTPENISYGSKKKVWWHCSKGHEWQAIVTLRTSGHSTCPYCCGKRPCPGENDLATLYPQLAKEWDSKKNGDLKPSDVLPGSHKLVWWRCSKGHEWQAIVKSRTSGTGCPTCANRRIIVGENDLESQYPELVKEWNTEKNINISPKDFVPGSQKKVWWRCPKGHEWQASILSRTSSSSGCPVCTGKKVIPGDNDLESKFPKIAAQWNKEKNGALTARNVSPYSNRRVWWTCKEGHDYRAAVSSRTAGGSDCPYCSGRKVLVGFNDLATTEPEVAAQWHPTLNGSLTPQMVTAGSAKKVWWKCKEGHQWQAVIYSRTGDKKCGCPVCARGARTARQNRYKAIQGEQMAKRRQAEEF